MQQTPQAPQRPKSLTVICIIGFIGAAFSVPLVFSPIAAQIASWYPPYLAFSSIVGLTCMIGLWKMKKWGAYAYLAFVALNQIVLFATGKWSFLALLIPGIVAYIAMKNVDKMS